MECSGENSCLVGSAAKKRKCNSPNDSLINDHKFLKLDVSSSDGDSAFESQDTSVELSPSFSESVQEFYIRTLDLLPDDVLLHLFTFLNATDLYRLSLCNRRLNALCHHKSLWFRVHAVCNGQWPSHRQMRPFFNSLTTRMHLSKLPGLTPCELAQSDEDSCIEHSFLSCLKSLPNLKTFILENHTLSTEIFNLNYLPESVTELRLTGTNLFCKPDRQNAVFRNVHMILPNLEIVDVSYCQWLHPQLLFSLSKCPKIKALIMIGCRSMKDIIPYASIAALFGYPTLETLDMRLTYVGDSEVGCFNKIKNLKHILLEKPNDVLNEDDDESITDICTTNLGMRNWHPEVNNDNVFICRVPLEGGDFVEDTLETLVVRNYPRITDITLKHAEKCLKSLKFLDVTGSSCSAEQIAIFKSRRPEVKLLHGGIVS